MSAERLLCGTPSPHQNAIETLLSQRTHGLTQSVRKRVSAKIGFDALSRFGAIFGVFQPCPHTANRESSSKASSCSFTPEVYPT